jgi:hypothetical protein
MAVREVRIEIEHLARELENRKHEKAKTVLILGSRAGALFRSQKFYDDIAYLSPKNLTMLSVTEQFSEAYSILKAEKDKNPVEDIRILLVSAIKNSMHSTEDTSLAELVKQNVFDTIFSLNMDDLLYSAFIRHEMKPKQDFADFAFGLWQPEYTVRDILEYTRLNTCKLIRIYSDEQSFVYRLNNAKAHEENSRCMKQLLEKWKVKELLIVGWDPVWDERLLSVLPTLLKTVWFVNEDENAKKAFLAYYHSCENFYYIRTTYKGFCNGLRTQIAPDFISLDDFSRTALHDIQAIRSELQELRELILQTQKEIGQVQKSIGIMRDDIIERVSRVQHETRDLQQMIDRFSSNDGGGKCSSLVQSFI